MIQQPDDPDEMTPEARFQELAILLATGFLLSRGKEPAFPPQETEHFTANRLDSSDTTSHVTSTS